jgi:hypothetical protein
MVPPSNVAICATILERDTTEREETQPPWLRIDKSTLLLCYICLLYFYHNSCRIELQGTNDAEGFGQVAICQSVAKTA